MIKLSTIIHLRFPFSLFLLPIYLFALSQSYQISTQNVVLSFIILHFLVYPASNGYNSYFDKDEGSIGGVRNPPKVSIELFGYALLLDAIALVLSFLIGWQFTIGILIYGLASKAYSHPSIRLKKYPVTGWLTIAIFQGFLIYIISFMAINQLEFMAVIKEAWWPGVLASLLLMGSYPMTQIYQHEEDKKRGDITLSYKLGIAGTFYFTASFFSISIAGFIMFFGVQSLWLALMFLIFLLPTILFFSFWYLKVKKNERLANFQNTMKLNLISSISLTLFFLVSFFFLN